MPKLNHKQKIKIAVKGMTSIERKLKVSKFQSKFWVERSQAIRERVLRREAVAKKKAEERRKKLLSQ